MAFSHTGGETVGGSGTTLTIGGSTSWSTGDLVAVWINRNGTATITPDEAGWTEAVNIAVPDETAREALFWRIIGASDPTSFGFTFGASDFYRAVLTSDASVSAPVVDSAANAPARSASTSTNLVCNAADGRTISDNAISYIFGGMDNRAGGGTISTWDNSYTAIAGNNGNQVAAGAYRIYTTGTTFSGNITATNPGSNPTDYTYSTHISFVESAGGGTKTVGFDSVLRKNNNTKTASIDAVLRQNAITKSALFDAVLQKTTLLQSSIDAALLKNNNLKTAQIDAILKDTYLLSAQIDAVLKNTTTKTISFDAVLTAAGTLTKTTSFDVVIQQLKTLSASVGAVLQKQGNTKSVGFDAQMIKVTTLQASFDSLLLKVQTASASFDAVLQKVANLLTISCDARFISGIWQEQDNSVTVWTSQSNADATWSIQSDAVTVWS